MVPRFIFVIRHGEKPNPADAVDPPFGVGAQGDPDVHGLTPRGWQRAGALAVLFAPFHGQPARPLVRPDHLVASAIEAPDETRRHRPFLTLVPLGQLLDLEVETRFQTGQEARLVDAILAGDHEAPLICWVHEHIPSLASHIPVSGGVRPPTTWPDTRVDLVWCFERTGDGATYAFSAIGQRLLAGDAEH